VTAAPRAGQRGLRRDAYQGVRRSLDPGVRHAGGPSPTRGPSGRRRP